MKFFTPRLPRRFSFLGGAVPLSLSLLCSCAHATPNDYFRIKVVDEATGRGVPLVELRTTNDVRYITDSNGIVAINDPEFIGQKLFFQVKSSGYDFPKDFFGYRGAPFMVQPGKEEQINLKRINIAERLYRITGAGIYRDSVLSGVPVPLNQPLLNGLVMGQDTVEATPYKGKIFWLWGDTNRAAYPLGNFKTSSATSLLPGGGGLDPSLGVNLTYWVNAEGFSKEMIPIESNSPVWMGGLFTLPDEKGRERLWALYAKAESDSKSSERGLAVFNDEKAIFEKVRPFDSTLVPGGDPFVATSGGQKWLYFDPFQRTLADAAHIVDGHLYQAYTPLVAGTKFDGAKTKLERDAKGQLVYGWKTDTARLGKDEVKTLVDAGSMQADEAPMPLRDIETDAPLVAQGSSTYWNPYRGRWVQIFTQEFGTSALGEQWFAEADTPTGPWVYARKIITHDKYTFYNPTQHPFFAQGNGRLIYFEGTYTATYSGNEERTPRYDYNQMMYRLDLGDPRLDLPVPVYLRRDGALSLRGGVGAKTVASIPFFALAPSAKPDGLIAFYGGANGLTTQANVGQKPLFYALPATAKDGEKPSPGVVPLYEYERDGKRFYSTDAGGSGPAVTRTGAPLCRVWRNPSRLMPLDFDTQATGQY